MAPPEPPEGLAIASGWWADLAVRYARPQRSYHTLEHVREVWAQWSAVDAEGLWKDRASTWAAVLLHDVIYELGTVKPGSNERASAALVASWTAEFRLSADVRSTERLILATANHGGHTPADDDEALFLDCDMAILGADADRYALYADQVREEYEPHLPPGVYNAGRAAFLATLIGKPIYLSRRFREAREGAAQRNLAWELSSLH